MYKTYLRHSDGRMHSVSRRLSPDEALVEYRRLLAREDLIGTPWAAILRLERAKRTLLFSRFDKEKQRLLLSDPIDLAKLTADDDANEDLATRDMVANRSKSAG